MKSAIQSAVLAISFVPTRSVCDLVTLRVPQSRRPRPPIRWTDGPGRLLARVVPLADVLIIGRPATVVKPKDFATFLYVGQALPATVIRYAAEAHRRRM